MNTERSHSISRHKKSYNELDNPPDYQSRRRWLFYQMPFEADHFVLQQRKSILTLLHFWGEFVMPEPG